MAKLSDAQAKALRAIVGNPAAPIPARTLAGLRSRWMVADVPAGLRITQTGAYALEAYRSAEREAARQAERAARPVPADAFVEPSAKNAPTMPVEYEDEPEDETEPTVPQAWIDQLVTFLRHGAKLRKLESGGWYAEPGHSGFSLNHTPERLDATVREAIRRGIVRELPPTATGVIRLQLAQD